MNKQEALELIKNIYEICAIGEKENKEMLVNEKFRKVLSDIDLISNYHMSTKIMNYFIATFQNISSNSMLLCKDTDPNHRYYDKEEITIGKYGFGIRANKQAKPVEDISNLKILKKHLPEIIKALNNRKKWNKADELEKFFEIVDFEMPIILVFKDKLKCPIKLPLEKNITAIRTYDTINIGIRKDNSVYTYLTQEKYPETKLSIVDKVDNYYDNIVTYVSLLINFILSDQVDFITESLYKYVKKLNKERKEVLDKLDTNFGKYIMARNL